MARAMVDKCAVHTATGLSQRVVCASFDHDMFARADKHFESQQNRVHDAVVQSFAAVLRREHFTGPAEPDCPPSWEDARCGPDGKEQESLFAGQL